LNFSSGRINVFINVPQGIQREKGYNGYSRMRYAQRNEAGGTIHREARLGQVLTVKEFVRSSVVPRKSTVSAAYEQASEWTVRRSQVQAQHKKTMSKREGETKEDVECWEYLMTGHISRDCQDPANLRRKAFKEIAKKKWKKKNRSEEASAYSSGLEYDKEIGVAMMQFDEDAMATRSSRVRSIHPLEIGFETMCSHHSFGEGKLLTDVEFCEPVTNKGIGETIIVSRVGRHRVFGRVYLNEGVPNLLSVGQLTSKISKAEGVGVRLLGGAFKVSKGDASYIFENDGRSLFVTDASSDLNNEEVYSIETIEDNERLHTKKQVMATRRVRVYASAMAISRFVADERKELTSVWMT
jgi:hypothetical protein